LKVFPEYEIFMEQNPLFGGTSKSTILITALEFQIPVCIFFMPFEGEFAAEIFSQYDIGTASDPIVRMILFLVVPQIIVSKEGTGAQLTHELLFLRMGQHVHF